MKNQIVIHLILLVHVHKDTTTVLASITQISINFAHRQCHRYIEELFVVQTSNASGVNVG